MTSGPRSRARWRGPDVSQYTIPTVVEKAPGGERAYDIYSRLLSERIIFLGTEIDDGVANVIMAQLLHLEFASPDLEIGLYINSPGGSYSAMTAIYDTMQYIRPDVATICMGQAASAAAVLLAAGTPGKRAVLRHAKVLLHQPSGEARAPCPTWPCRPRRWPGSGRTWRRSSACTPVTRWPRSGWIPTATRPSARRKQSTTAWRPGHHHAEGRSGRAPQRLTGPGTRRGDRRRPAWRGREPNRVPGQGHGGRGPRPAGRPPGCPRARCRETRGTGRAPTAAVPSVGSPTLAGRSPARSRRRRACSSISARRARFAARLRPASASRSDSSSRRAPHTAARISEEASLRPRSSSDR